MIRLFSKFRRRDWICLAAAVVFIVAQVWLDLKMPDYMSEITTLVQTPGSEMAAVLAAGAKMLACALGSLCSALMVAVMAARVATDFGADTRRRMFAKIQSFSMGEIGKFSTASLITRSSNDIQQVQMLIVMGLQSIVKAPIMAVCNT